MLDIEALIEREVFLRQSIQDIQVFDDTLVALTDDGVPPTFVRMILSTVWAGPVEVYCASALMIGSTAELK